MPKGVYERVIIPAETRFLRLAVCDLATRCWNWTGTKDQKGYGKLQVGTFRSPKKVTAPRFSWEMRHGPIPEGRNVLHRCDNPACVSPEHLFLGTTADNMLDKKTKGRAPHGEEIPSAKLTEELVREIRRLHAAGILTNQRVAAAHYGVTSATISLVINRKIWQHVDG